VIDIVTHKFNEFSIKNKDEIHIYQSIFNKTKDLNLIDPHKINNSSYITNIKTDFTGQIDYIFYSNDLSLDSQVSFIDINNYIEEKALPNSFHGSDHLYLISKFYV
jgi:mRNA deadenylase 3'-5' endonuclease subunit Ccr4